MKNIIYISFLLFFSTMVMAQKKDYSDNLKTAVELYEKGLYQQAIDTINFEKSGKKNRKSKVKDSTSIYKGMERETAFKTLISCYNELDEIEKADEKTKEFLKENPIYEPYGTDPLPFVENFERFEVRPLFSINAKVGFGIVLPDVKSTNTIWDAANYRQKYNHSVGRLLSIGLEWHINQKFSLSADIEYQKHNFSREIKASPNFNANYDETYSDIKIPILLHYIFYRKESWYASVFGGLYCSKMIIATGDFSVNDVVAITGRPSTKYEDGLKNISMLDNRNAINGGFLAGISLKREYRRLTFSFNMSYAQDVINYTRAENKYNTQRLFYDYYYIDDVIKMKNYYWSIGISHCFSYKITKKY